MNLIGCADELGSDAHSFSGAAHRAFQQEIHAQFARDFMDALVRSFVLYGRGAGNDTQPRRVQPSQLGNHLLGQAVRKILLFRIAAQVLKRKHREHGRGVGGSPPSDQTRNLDGEKEPVAAPGQRFNEARIRRRIAQRFAQFVDGRVESIVEIDIRVGGPQPAAQVIACDDGAGLLQQHLQNLERLPRELQPDPGLPKLTAPEIRFECSKTYDGRIHETLPRVVQTVSQISPRMSFHPNKLTGAQQSRRRCGAIH